MPPTGLRRRSKQEIAMMQPRRTEHSNERGHRSLAAAARRRARPCRSAAIAAAARAVETLEPRVLFSTFVVSSTADAGGGSLRQAILDANANPGADQITFNLPGAGTHAMALS